MNRNLLSGLAIGIFVGFLGGYFVGAGRSGDAPALAAAPGAPAPGGPVPGGAPLPPRPNPLELQARIQSNQKVVAADPRNVQAWIALGNDYFDSQQAQQAVDAYAKALALHPDDPDVLTDQGVMYRELKQFPKALANFQKANKLNPRHLASLYNLGVVYSQDLHQPAEARKAWNKVLELDPTNPQADQARAALASLGN